MNYKEYTVDYRKKIKVLRYVSEKLQEEISAARNEITMLNIKKIAFLI